MKTAMLIALPCTACVTSAADDYPVVAFAELHAGDASITGRIELLGGESPDGPAAQPDRVLAAYRVRLPDAAPRRVRLYYDDGLLIPGTDVIGDGVATCDTPTERLYFLSDLQTIQRVGDQAHFVIPDVRVRDRSADIDVETLPVSLSLDDRSSSYAIGKIVVISGPDRDDGRPGARLACGQFVAAPPR